MSVPLRVALCLPLLAVAGCSSLSEPAGISYAKAVTQLGINPVYPPREDIQVGDIYAIEDHSYAERLKAKSAFFDTYDITDDIQSYLRSRYKFRNTVVDVKEGKDDAVKREQVDARERTPLLAESDLTTLPVDGLPQIEVDSGITVGVQGQPQGLAAAFGFAAAKTLKMSLQFGTVTSYEVPISVAERDLGNYCGVQHWACENAYLANAINEKYQLGKKNPASVSRAAVLMVSKVYLARQITYTFNDATLAAAVATTVGDDGQAAPATPMVTQADIDKLMGQKNPQMLDAAAGLVNSLSNLQTSKGGATGRFQIGVANKQVVSITEIFDRPVVIAYEGVSTLGVGPGQQIGQR